MVHLYLRIKRNNKTIYLLSFIGIKKDYNCFIILLQNGEKVKNG